jgi:hypothetical protein
LTAPLAGTAALRSSTTTTGALVWCFLRAAGVLCFGQVPGDEIGSVPCTCRLGGYGDHKNMLLMLCREQIGNWKLCC